MHRDEPHSSEDVAAWVARATAERDRFRDVALASDAHREFHGCDVYPTSSGPLLGVLAAATAPRRVLEVGCGLGYSAMWLAHGAGAGAKVDTCERDTSHAAIARHHFVSHGFDERITVREGLTRDLLPTLSPPYHFVFCDGDPDAYSDDFDQFMRLLAPGGLLVTSNLFLGVHVPDAPVLAAAAAYRERLLGDALFLTGFLPGGLALSVKAR